MDAALARLVADAADAGDDASKLTEALKQAGLETNNDVIVYDFDDDEAQAARGTPAEEKYRALARDATRALVDKELRPDAEEGRALKRVMSAPGDSLASSDLELLWKFRPVWKSKFYGAFNAIDATHARWRGDAGSSPLDRARTAASSPRK